MRFCIVFVSHRNKFSRNLFLNNSLNIFDNHIHINSDII